MDNENFAQLIKDGHTEYSEQLWENIKQFVKLKAVSYGRPECVEDMLQEAFIYMLKAVDSYNPDAGSTFLSYFAHFHMPSAFKAAIYGGRSDKVVKDPLNVAISLDVPVSDDEGSPTLLEQLIDINSETYYRRIEDADYWRNVRETLRKGIERIDRPEVREVMQYHLDYDATIKAGSEAMGVPYSRYIGLYRYGLRYLRRFLISRSESEKLKTGLADYLGSCRYYATGLQAYRNNIFTSAVEKIALEDVRLAERRQAAADTLAMMRRKA